MIGESHSFSCDINGFEKGDLKRHTEQTWQREKMTTTTTNNISNNNDNNNDNVKKTLDNVQVKKEKLWTIN